jgi:hypothetical protein
LPDPDYKVNFSCKIKLLIVHSRETYRKETSLESLGKYGRRLLE